MSLFLADEIKRLHGQLDTNPDVGPDERIRAIADVTLLRIFGLGLGVVLFGVGMVAGWLVMVKLINIIESPLLAVLSALFGTALSMAFPAVGVRFVRGLQRRRLRRALRIADGRRKQLVDSTSADGSAVAVPSSLSMQPARK